MDRRRFPWINRYPRDDRPLPWLVKPGPILDPALMAGGGGEGPFPEPDPVDQDDDVLSPEQAAAVLQFGRRRCLVTTVAKAGDVEHTHVCVREPHPEDEAHCSPTLYVWSETPADRTDDTDDDGWWAQQW